MLVANRDVPPLATQGAGDNASGVAALIELANAFGVTAHDHTLIFLCTTGGAYGALGARDFVRFHQTDDLYGVIAMRDVAKRASTGVSLDGWSSVPRWLRRGSGCLPRRPRAATPTSTPTCRPWPRRFCALPSPRVRQPGAVRGGRGAGDHGLGLRPPCPADDTLDSVSAATLTRVGTTVQDMVMAIDGTAAPGMPSGGTIFLTSSATLPGGALAAILAALLLPLVAVTVDLFAHCRRIRIALRPALVRAGLHLAPWLVLMVIVYLADLVGCCPTAPTLVPPHSHLATSPRYLRVVVLAVLLILAYAYAVAVERRLERRFATDPRATIFASHALLVLIALLLLLVNPYGSCSCYLPAFLRPLARPGGWMRSLLPVYLGLSMILIPLLYYAVQLDVGWKVWWYFFLLFENRTVPATAVLLAVLFFSTAGVLAHTLHERGLAPEALVAGR